MSFEVDIQRVSGCGSLPEDEALRRWAEQVLLRHVATAAVSVRLVDEPEGAELNAEFRGGAGATNVLSFPFEAGRWTHPPLLGDVVICAPVVNREAREQGKSPRAHCAHMLVHGLLHLLGHDHQEEDAAQAMESLERCHLRTLGFADPYRVEAHE